MEARRRDHTAWLLVPQQSPRATAVYVRSALGCCAAWPSAGRCGCPGSGLEYDVRFTDLARVWSEQVTGAQFGALRSRCAFLAPDSDDSESDDDDENSGTVLKEMQRALAKPTTTAGGKALNGYCLGGGGGAAALPAAGDALHVSLKLGHWPNTPVEWRFECSELSGKEAASLLQETLIVPMLGVVSELQSQVKSLQSDLVNAQGAGGSQPASRQPGGSSQPTQFDATQFQKQAVAAAGRALASEGLDPFSNSSLQDLFAAVACRRVAEPEKAAEPAAVAPEPEAPAAAEPPSPAASSTAARPPSPNSDDEMSELFVGEQQRAAGAKIYPSQPQPQAALGAGGASSASAKRKAPPQAKPRKKGKRGRGLASIL